MGKKFKVGDIVFVTNNDDSEYEEKYDLYRYHTNFFGKVTEVTEYENETVVEVAFERGVEWSYNANELSHAKELKDMTLEDFSNKYGVIVNATYI